MQTVAQTYLILFRLHGTGVDVAIGVGHAEARQRRSTAELLVVVALGGRGACVGSAHRDPSREPWV